MVAQPVSYGIKCKITVDTISFLAPDHHLRSKIDSILNVFCDGLFLLYRFKVEHQADLFTCRLEPKF